MRQSRFFLIFLLLLTALFFLPSLFVRGLWSPDEPRYAAVAWHMRQTGRWLVPRINNELYPEKPPLFFYLAAAADVVAAPHGGKLVEAAAMAVLALCVLTFTPKRENTPVFAVPILLLTACLSLEIGKFGVIDALLVAFQVVAILLARKSLTSPNPLVPCLGMYAALALGCLTKGPVIIPFVLLALAGSAGTEGVKASLRRHLLCHIVGLACFAVLICAWLIPACRAGGEQYTSRLLGQIAGRVTGARRTHIQPWYYYFVTSLYVFFPWTLLLVAALIRSVRSGRELRWLLLWFVGGFLLLSSFASKRHRYLFLILPAGAALTAWYLYSPQHKRLDRACLLSTGLLCTASGVLLAVFGFAAGSLPSAFNTLLPSRAERYLPALTQFVQGLSPLSRYLFCPPLAAAACWGGLLCCRASEGKSRFVLGLCLWAAAMSLAFDVVVSPALDPLKTGTRFVAAVKRYAGTGADLALYARHYDGRFNMATGRIHLPRVGTSDRPEEHGAEIAQFLNRSEPAAVIAGWRRMDPASLPPAFRPWHILASGLLGHRHMFLIGNKPARALFRALAEKAAGKGN